MKKNYVTPQIIVRYTRVKSYILSNSQYEETNSMLKHQLTKERDTYDDIWGNSSGEEESIW